MTGPSTVERFRPLFDPQGVNVADGKVTYRPVADATGQPYTELFDVLGEGAPA